MSGLARASEPAVDRDLHGWLQRLSELMSWEFGVGGTTLTVGAVSGALLSLVLIVLLGLWIRSRVNRYADTREFSRRASLYTVGKLAFYLMIVVAVLISLAVLGIPISRFAVVAGALGVGLGFGLQAIFNNFVSGLILLIERPIRTGDWIVVGSTEGYVKKIAIRSTQIQTFDRADVIVPNSELISGQVTNWMLRDSMGRVRAPVGVAYGSDTQLVKQTLLEVGRVHPEVITDGRVPEPTVIFVRFGDSTLDFELRCFIRNVDRRLAVLSDLNFAIDAAFRKAGIEIAFPQLDLHVRDMPPPTPPA